MSEIEVLGIWDGFVGSELDCSRLEIGGSEEEDNFIRAYYDVWKMQGC